MKNIMKKFGILGVVSVVILLTSLCLLLIAILYSHNSNAIMYLGIITLLVTGTLPALFVYNWQKNGATQLSSQEEEKIKALLESRMKNPNLEGNEAQDILQLTLINTKQLRWFYSESRQQAKKAFLLAVTMCIIGGLLLCLSIVSIIFLHMNPTTWTIGTIGGVFVEFIAGTSFYIYQKSLKQYNRYYRSLHENERLLLILHLTSKLTNDTPQHQVNMYIEIIRSQLTYINKEFWMDNEYTFNTKQNKTAIQ